MRTNRDKDLRGLDGERLASDIDADSSIDPVMLVERTELLARVHRTMVDPSGPPVVLLGEPGVGKSSLIRLYLSKHFNDFQGVTQISALELSTDIALHPETFSILMRRRFALAFGTDPREERNPIEYLNRVLPPRRHLLVLDDLDRLPHEAAARMLKVVPYQHPRMALLLAARSAYMTSSEAFIEFPQRYANAFSRPWMLISVPTLSLQELHELVVRRFKYLHQDLRVVENFFTALATKNTAVELLSPRFVLQLLKRYLISTDLDQALIDTVQDYFPKMSALAVAESDAGILAFPTSEAEPMRLLGRNGATFTGTPLIIVHNARNLWLHQIEEFQELIGHQEIRENTLQDFFERHRHFLKGIDYAEVFPQVVLERDDEGALIPDFLLRPLDSRYADVLDLKLPTERLVVGPKDRKHLGAAVQSAIAQVREYRDYFERHDYRKRLREIYGITAYRPKCIVVIGRRPHDVQEEEVRRILDDVPSYLKIMTYEDLLSRMKEQAYSYRV